MRVIYHISLFSLYHNVTAKLLRYALNYQRKIRTIDH